MSTHGDPPKCKSIDIDMICSHLQQYNENINSLSLSRYLEAYRELNRFLEIFGKVFYFVTKDIESKINILQSYIDDESTGAKYTTVQSMIEYEREENLLTNQDRQSGARTLLRLHRALEFISLFTGEIARLNENEATGPAARRSYQKTLANYHPWYIRKAASAAMCALPSKIDMAVRALGQPKEECDPEVITQKMLRLSELSEISFQITEKLYEDNKLLDLP
ncbi:ceramide-1-phosphate transfer protein [Brevipalpus obovatus]|uniref:ceramide-1-phosphate transfer protein n=1 Tax=Brevipalpus obovatus TaxID=246614 RepID=UPI003D9E198C